MPGSRPVGIVLWATFVVLLVLACATLAQGASRGARSQNLNTALPSVAEKDATEVEAEPESKGVRTTRGMPTPVVGNHAVVKQKPPTTGQKQSELKGATAPNTGVPVISSKSVYGKSSFQKTNVPSYKPHGGVTIDMSSGGVMDKNTPKQYGINGRTKTAPNAAQPWMSDRTNIACGSKSSRLFFDRCGVCNGNNTCVDCKNVTHGKSRMDKCRECDGANKCLGCDGIAWSGKAYDICDVCGGDGSTCLDCHGNIEKDAQKRTWYDACGVCGGDGTTCCGSGGDCSGHGVCTKQAKGCECETFYAGPFCNVRKNMCGLPGGITENCGGRGTCDPNTGLCTCSPKYTGDKCQLKSCSGHGFYRPKLGMCKCYKGYTGQDCSYCAAPPADTSFICMMMMTTTAPGESDEAKALGSSSKNGKSDNSLPQGYWNAENMPSNMLQAVVQPLLDSSNDNSILFRRTFVDENSVAAHIGGLTDLASSHGGVVILPGALYNGTVYGCDCRPATPVEDKHGKAVDDPWYQDYLAALAQYGDTGNTGNTKDQQQESSTRGGRSLGNNQNSLTEKEQEAPDATTFPTVQEIRQNAYELLWGSFKKDKPDSQKGKDAGDGKVDQVLADAAQNKVNSVTIAREGKLKELQKSLDNNGGQPFTVEERDSMGDFMHTTPLVTSGRIFGRFIEARAPIDFAGLKDEYETITDEFGLSIDLDAAEEIDVKRTTDDILTEAQIQRAVPIVFFNIMLGVVLFLCIGGFFIVLAFKKWTM